MKVLVALRRPAAAFLLDIILVIVFAAVGRASHDEAGPVAGSLQTAWPFLAGTVVGWLVVRLLRKEWPVDVGPGITVWFATLLIGMVLRRLTGAGTATTFVVVAALVLAVLIVGWRVLASYAARRASRARVGGRPA
jgi:hypothetical protein